MKDCDRQQESAPFFDRELPEGATDNYAAHVQSCAECEKALRQVEEISQAFEPLRKISPNSAAVSRIHASLRAQNNAPVISIFRFAAAAAAVVALCCGGVSYYLSSQGTRNGNGGTLLEIAAYAQAEAYTVASGDDTNYIALMISEHQGVTDYE